MTQTHEQLCVFVRISVIMCVLPGKSQKLKDAEEQSQAFILPLQTHKNNLITQNTRLETTKVLFGSHPESSAQRQNQTSLKKQKTHEHSEESPTESDPGCRETRSHQHDGGGDGSLFSTHGLQLAEWTHQEHGAGTKTYRNNVSKESNSQNHRSTTPQ